MFKRTFVCFLLLLILSTITAQKPGDKVLSVFVDEFGHQWFGTDNGLLRKAGNVWKGYPVQPDSPGTVNDIEHQITPEGSVLWIGTLTGIIKVTYSVDAVTSATHYTSKSTSFLSDNINDIAFDERTTGFFATPAGIGILANAIWSFLTQITDVEKNRFTSAKAKGDTIFFGTGGEGVARLVKSADGYSGASSFVTPWSALPGDNITCILVDSKGYQWFGTDKGISRHSKFDANEGWDISLTDKLPNQYVTAISEDKNGNIWIGTRGGLVKLGADMSTTTTWSVTNGLPSDIINDIFIDKDSSVWIGTDLGAAHFNGSGFTNIRTSDYSDRFIKFKRLIK